MTFNTCLLQRKLKPSNPPTKKTPKTPFSSKWWNPPPPLKIMVKAIVFVPKNITCLCLEPCNLYEQKSLMLYKLSGCCAHMSIWNISHLKQLFLLLFYISIRMVMMFCFSDFLFFTLQRKIIKVFSNMRMKTAFQSLFTGFLLTGFTCPLVWWVLRFAKIVQVIQHRRYRQIVIQNIHWYDKDLLVWMWADGSFLPSFTTCDCQTCLLTQVLHMANFLANTAMFCFGLYFLNCKNFATAHQQL